jgi:hypothetical protein
LDAIQWIFSAFPPCESTLQAATAAPAATFATTEQQLVECDLCYEETGEIVSCSAGHKVCGACFDRTIVDFNFTDRQKCLSNRQLEAPDLHSWPFMCTLCLEENVCNLYPIGSCMGLIRESSTRSLFNHLRKFKLDEEDGDSGTGPEVSTSEVDTVRRMVAIFFNPSRCPACHTPFAHDGGCMAMKCGGRPGVFCQAHFCLWCLRVPRLVSVLGPNSTLQDRDGACHRHVFACPLAPLASSTPGKSRLYPTEDAENSEWIIAWHHLQNIKKALRFLREMVSPNTASAVMAATDVAKMFADAGDFIRDRLTKFPEDRLLLRLPELKLDDYRFNSFEVPFDVSSSSDSDDLPAGRLHMRVPRGVGDDDDAGVLGHVRPRPNQLDLPPAQRAVHLPPAQHVNFAEEVQFVVEATGCSRRAAIDALMAQDTAEDAIVWLLNQ